MMYALLLLLCLAFPLQGSVPQPPPLDVVVVIGAPGTQEYETAFRTAGENWLKAAREGGREALLIAGETNQMANLREVLGAQNKTSDDPFWLVFIGHGTFDGKVAKFNLHGPDISAAELAALVAEWKRPLVFLNTTSSSSPFLNALSGENRIVVTATKSGWEENYARFGIFLAETIADPSADLDKDGQTSLLEGFLMASRRVEEFYDTEQRLATEHALIDDNGDSYGSPADFFQGVRVVKKAEGDIAVDGLRAHQVHLVPGAEEAKLSPEAVARRNQLELDLEKLRSRQADLPEEVYLDELEKVLVEISRIYHSAGATADEPASVPPESGEKAEAPVQ